MASATHCERIVIVGGGVSGLSIAVRLAQSGLPVTLCEAVDLGFEASTRNQGWLHSGALFARQNANLAQICHQSLQQTLRFCPDCIEPHHQGMYYILSKPETPADEWTAAWEKARISFQHVEKKQVLDQLPGLDSSRIQQTFLLPDRAFRPDVLLAQLADTAQNLGVEIRTHTPITELIHQDHIVQGVITGSGEEIHARQVILATGALAGRYWSEVFTPLAGAQPGLTRVILKTHLIAIEPLLGPIPFCVVDRDGFNHIPHQHVSVLGTNRWHVVSRADDIEAEPEEIRILWEDLADLCPECHRDQCTSIQQWAGTTQQVMQVEQIDPTVPPLPAVIDHRQESPSYENLWSVYPGRATLWPRLAEAAYQALIENLGECEVKTNAPPWS